MHAVLVLKQQVAMLPATSSSDSVAHPTCMTLRSAESKAAIKALSFIGESPP